MSEYRAPEEGEGRVVGQAYAGKGSRIVRYYPLGAGKGERWFALKDRNGVTLHVWRERHAR